MPGTAATTADRAKFALDGASGAHLVLVRLAELALPRLCGGLVLLLPQYLVHLRAINLSVRVKEVVLDACVVVGVEVLVAFHLSILEQLPVVDVALVDLEALAS